MKIHQFLIHTFRTCGALTVVYFFLYISGIYTNDNVKSVNSLFVMKQPKEPTLVDGGGGESPGQKRVQTFGQGDPVSSVQEMSDEDLKLIEEASKVQPIPFDTDGSDILVYIHAQKAGGSVFESHLVLDTDVKPPCTCKKKKKLRYKCQCPNHYGRNWMFQRAAVGWPCGIHPDLTQLTACAPRWLDVMEGGKRERTYHYVTMLREPIPRFLSEWMVLKRGAEWGAMNLSCDGRKATTEEVPPCPKLGRGVSFGDFINCRSNLAFNRQTRMLANLSLSDCYRLDSKYSRAQRDGIMLQSAKKNLAKFFNYFGLVGFQKESGVLFNKMFNGLAFNLSTFQNKPASEMHATEALNILSQEEIQRAEKLNALDVELYSFGKVLFMNRLREADISLYD